MKDKPEETSYGTLTFILNLKISPAQRISSQFISFSAWNTHPNQKNNKNPIIYSRISWTYSTEIDYEY